MFKSIFADLQSTFRYGNMLNRIIIINVIVFIIVKILSVFLAADVYQSIMEFFSLSYEWKEFLLHPWAIITHMFIHEGFWHLFFNMLILYWFGLIVGDLLGDRRVLPVYILGGLAGAAVFFISMNFLSFFGDQGYPYGIGASAGVMSIVFAAAITSPNYIMRLILIGDVRIKYIALFLLLIDIFWIGSMKNTGGHFAHLGGAGFGLVFVTMLRNGKDLSESFNRLYDKLLSYFNNVKEKPRKSPLNVVHKKDKNDTQQDNNTSQLHQEKLDKILEKISQHGYDKLTDEEKEFLYQASKK
jgi:membrane associated rhomboid family serine protease